MHKYKIPKLKSSLFRIKDTNNACVHTTMLKNSADHEKGENAKETYTYKNAKIILMCKSIITATQTSCQLRIIENL